LEVWSQKDLHCKDFFALHSLENLECNICGKNDRIYQQSTKFRSPLCYCRKKMEASRKYMNDNKQIKFFSLLRHSFFMSTTWHCRHSSVRSMSSLWLSSIQSSRVARFEAFLFPVVLNSKGVRWGFQQWKSRSFCVLLNRKTCQHIGIVRTKQLPLYCCLSSEAVVRLNTSELPATSNIPPSILEKTKEKLHLLSK